MEELLWIVLSFHNMEACFLNITCSTHTSRQGTPLGRDYNKIFRLLSLFAHLTCLCERLLPYRFLRKDLPATKSNFRGMFSHLLTDVINFSFLQAYITLKGPVEWLTPSLDSTRHERQRHLQETFHSESSVLLSASYVKKKILYL